MTNTRPDLPLWLDPKRHLWHDVRSPATGTACGMAVPADAPLVDDLLPLTREERLSVALQFCPVCIDTRLAARLAEHPQTAYMGVIGWCHSCETTQMGDEARWLPMAWNRGQRDWACVNCDDEPWGLGVHENITGEGRWTTTASAWIESPAGLSWLALDECGDCGGKHHDPADCPNPPDDEGG